MKMKKFINEPENLTEELLEGLALANPEMLKIEDNHLVVNRKLETADRVTIVTMGGSGHEPCCSGFVGEGMIDISVIGDIFAAPGPQACGGSSQSGSGKRRGLYCPEPCRGHAFRKYGYEDDPSG